jgi:hypothetical protein
LTLQLSKIELATEIKKAIGSELLINWFEVKTFRNSKLQTSRIEVNFLYKDCSDRKFHWFTELLRWRKNQQQKKWGFKVSGNLNTHGRTWCVCKQLWFHFFFFWIHLNYMKNSFDDRVRLKKDFSFVATSAWSVGVSRVQTQKMSLRVRVVERQRQLTSVVNMACATKATYIEFISI